MKPHALSPALVLLALAPKAASVPVDASPEGGLRGLLRADDVAGTCRVRVGGHKDGGRREAVGMQRLQLWWVLWVHQRDSGDGANARVRGASWFFLPWLDGMIPRQREEGR